MLLLGAFVAVLWIVLGVIWGSIPLAMLGAALLLAIDPRRAWGERTNDAMFHWERYQRAARKRHGGEG